MEDFFLCSLGATILVLNMLFYVAIGLWALIAGFRLRFNPGWTELCDHLEDMSTFRTTLLIFGLIVVLFSVLIILDMNYNFASYFGLCTFMFILLVTMLVGPFVIRHYHQKMTDQVEANLKDGIDHFKRTTCRQQTRLQNKIQAVFACCGWDGAADYLKANDNICFPSGCCNIPSGSKCTPSHLVFKKGCSHILMLKPYSIWTIILAVFSYAIIQAILVYVMLEISEEFLDDEEEEEVEDEEEEV